MWEECINKQQITVMMPYYIILYYIIITHPSKMCYVFWCIVFVFVLYCVTREQNLTQIFNNTIIINSLCETARCHICAIII